MARKDRFGRKQTRSTIRRDAPEPRAARPEPKPPKHYGKPIIILEDAQKNTFEFVDGNWVPFAMTIAECRAECQIQMLPQQVNGKKRYEIRLPITSA
jgi:hypothetical protein